MLRSKAFVVLAFTACIIVVSVFPAFADTEYTPNNIFYFRPTTSSVYVPSEGGSSTYPLVVNSNGYWTDSQTGLFVGANYNGGGDNFVNHETYKLVMTFSCGAVSSITNPEASYLYALPSSPQVGMYNWIGRVESDIRPTTVGSGTSAITITFDNIPWSFVSGVSDIGVFIPKTSLSASGGIILLNCYLDLSSQYDETAYQKEVNERLDRIDQTLDNMLDEEEDRAEQGGASAEQEAMGNASSGEVGFSSLTNFADAYGGFLGQFSALCTSNEVLTYIPLPSGKVNLFGHEIDFFAGKDKVDLSPFLEAPIVQDLLTVVKCITTLGVLAVAVHWAHNVKEWITSTSPTNVPDIPFLPVPRG